MRLQKTARAKVRIVSIPYSAICNPTFGLAALCAILMSLPFPALAGQAPAGPPENEQSLEASYDEVVRDLVVSLGKGPVTAQDAAVKLARLGKRSVTVLTEVLKANFVAPNFSKDGKELPMTPAQAKANPQLAYYSALALSKIRLADAAKPLLPILGNPHAAPEIRRMLIEAIGLEFLPEAGVTLQKIASEDPDPDMRKRAYSQLSILPNFWIASEKVFVDALADPDDEIRAIAAKQCMYTRVYMTGTLKLIELAERDPQTIVRTNAMLALGRMRVRNAVPALVRVCANTETPAGVLQTTLRTLNTLTGVSLKDSAAVQTWWQKFGEAEYAKLEALTNLPEPAISATPAQPQPAGEKKDNP